MADVIAEIKSIVVHPDRSALNWRELEALPVAGKGSKTRVDVAAEALDVEAARRAGEGRGLEHRDRAHVHVGIGGLEGEERAVLRGEELVRGFGHDVLQGLRGAGGTARSSRLLPPEKGRALASELRRRPRSRRIPRLIASE